MAATKAELWDQLTKFVKCFDGFAENATSFVTNKDAAIQAFEGDHAGNTGATLNRVQAASSGS